MTARVEAENSPADVGEPPASSSTIWDGIRSKLHELDNWSHNYLEHRCDRRVAAGTDVDDNPDIPLAGETLADRPFAEMSGLERLRCIYSRTSGYEQVEWELTKRATTATGLSGFVIGGLLGQQMAVERFENYSVGRDFGNVRNAMRRKMDYTLLMFAKNGLGAALRIGLIGGLSVMTVLHVTVYRNKYCSYYSPLACSTFSALMMARGGARGLGMGFCLGIMPGLGISAIVLAYSVYNGLSVNDGYWQARDRMSDELRERRERKAKRRQLMRDEGIWLEAFAEHRLIEIEKAERKAQAEKAEASQSS